MQGFDFHRPTSLAQAVAQLRAGGGDAALIAGGHTLLPAIKSRLRAPALLIDLATIPGLAGVTLDGARVRVGAMTRHAALAASAIVAEHLPALAAAARLVGDPAVRARGTIGGALANNDPAADYPAAVLALDAEIETDRRRIAADDFFQGMFATALADDEIIAAVRFPAIRAAAYAKHRHPISRYALAGVFVARLDTGVRVAVTGAGPGVFRWSAAEAALDHAFSAVAVAGLVPDAAELTGDIHASAKYRAHLCAVMLARAIEGATA